MKVCLLFPYFKPHFGGVERVIEEVSKRLRKHEVHIITSKLPGTACTETYSGVHVHRVPSFLPESIPYPIPKGLGIDVLEDIGKINPDILVTHNVVSFYTPVALIYKWLYRKPLVLVMHTTDVNYGVKVLNVLLTAYYLLAGLMKNQFDLIVAPMENKLFRLKPDVIIPNGVDKKKFRRGDKLKARKKLGLPLTGKIVLFVGRFIPVKGIDNLIRIMNSSPDLRFVLLGEGYLKKKIIEETQDVVIHEPTDNIHLYYQAADACIIPSLAEGFCLTAIEAYACETPIVGSNVGILPHLTDYTFNPGDWEGMREALIGIASKETTPKREYKILDWDEIIGEYNRILENLSEKERVR